MEMNRFYVEMDNPSLSYFPGDSVTGRIIVHYQKVKQTEGILAKFTGLVRVSWSERFTRSSERIFKEKEIYFDETLSIIARNGGRNEITLQPGRNVFPFDFTLPDNLPSTYVGGCGSITYTMVAIMKKKWKPDKKVSVPFTVNEIVDLNTGSRNTFARMPIEEQKQKNVSCCFRKSGPISFTLKLPRSGFVPGEIMPIIVDLHNNSRKKIVRTEIILSQEIIYHAKKRSRMQCTILIQNSGGPTVGPGESETWHGINLQIPPVPPTSHKCKLIHVNYYLTLDLQISEMSSALWGKFRIIIGNVPLQNTFSELATLSQNREGLSENHPPEYDNVDLFSVSKSATIFQTYPDLPPPTYAEAVGFLSIGDEIPNASVAENPSGSTQSIELENFNGGNYIPKYITYG